jgi:hypothetical protein
MEKMRTIVTIALFVAILASMQGQMAMQAKLFIEKQNYNGNRKK